MTATTGRPTSYGPVQLGDGTGLEQDVVLALASAHDRYPWAVQGDWRVQVDTKRSASMRIRVDDYLVATLIVPPGTDPEGAAKFAVSKSRWVARQRNLLAPYVPEHPVKSLASGEGFLVFGRPYRLKVAADPAAPPIVLDDNPTGWLRLRADRDETTITGWYGHLLERTAAELGEGLYGRLGLGPAAVTYRAADLGPRRWCKYQRGVVRLHWSCAQLTRTVLEYVVAHALVHAVEGPGHGPGFRAAFGRVMPVPQRLEEELRQQGRRVWLGAVATRNSRETL